MKKVLTLLAVFAVIGTAALASESVSGFVFKEVVQPGDGLGAFASGRTGTAQCTSYFGVVALGDCSVAAAKKQGKISNVAHYDQEVFNILGFKRVTTRVYGQ